MAFFYLSRSSLHLTDFHCGHAIAVDVAFSQNCGSLNLADVRGAKKDGRERARRREILLSDPQPLSSSDASDAADISKRPGNGTDAQEQQRRCRGNRKEAMGVRENGTQEGARVKEIQNGTNRNACRGLNSLPWNGGSSLPEAFDRKSRWWLGRVSTLSISLAPDVFRSFNLHFSLVCAVRASVPQIVRGDVRDERG